MHVRIRYRWEPEAIIFLNASTTIISLKTKIQQKFNVETEKQRLFYGGTLLEDSCNISYYNIKINALILLIKQCPKEEICSEQAASSQNYGNDATSPYFELGDLVDVRDKDVGCWIEGRILRILSQRHAVSPTCLSNSADETSAFGGSYVSQADSQENSTRLAHDKITLEDLVGDRSSDNIPLSELKTMLQPPPSLSFASSTDSSFMNWLQGGHMSAEHHASRASTNGMPSSQIVELPLKTSPETLYCPPIPEPNWSEFQSNTFLLYKIELVGEEVDKFLFCTLNELRPRARRTLGVREVRRGDIVMVNYNLDDPLKKGYWFDFFITGIDLNPNVSLKGVLYLGPEGRAAVPNMELFVHDHLFAIEQVTLLEQRRNMNLPAPIKRTLALNCRICRGGENAPCIKCGCAICYVKEDRDQQVWCRQCNNKHCHTYCLPPQEEPEIRDTRHWVCPSCTDGTRTPLAQSQQIQRIIAMLNWGKGMTSVAKTKSPTLPHNHFGPMPGIDVGMCWRFRHQVVKAGLHRRLKQNVTGNEIEGAYSLVLSGMYDLQVDNGEEFLYIGSGARNQGLYEQSADQALEGTNKALAVNCAAEVRPEGNNARGNWRHGKPVRVLRSGEMTTNFSKYAPLVGIRYDGIYKVVRYEPARGPSEFVVWRYLLRRDDLAPAPWDLQANLYPMLYPEAEPSQYPEFSLPNKKVRFTTPDLDERICRYIDGCDAVDAVSPHEVARPVNDEDDCVIVPATGDETPAESPAAAKTVTFLVPARNTPPQAAEDSELFALPAAPTSRAKPVKTTSVKQKKPKAVSTTNKTRSAIRKNR